MSTKFIVCLTATLALPSVHLVSVTEADACSPSPERVRWTLPANGGAIPFGAPILVGFSGTSWGATREVKLTRSGESVAATLERRYTQGLFALVDELAPVEDLTEGEYTLHITYPDAEWSDDYSFSFTVDPSIDPAPLHGPVNFRWYRETLEIPSINSCYSQDELNYLSIDPLGEAPYYYEVIVSRNDADPVRYLRLPDQVDGTLGALYVTNVECVKIVAVGLGGQSTDSIERCQPDKCAHVDNADSHIIDFGTVDWRTIDACGEGTGPGDD